MFSIQKVIMHTFFPVIRQKYEHILDIFLKYKGIFYVLRIVIIYFIAFKEMHKKFEYDYSVSVKPLE